MIAVETTGSIYMDVKVFVGHDIRQVAREICALATRIDMIVCADMNDSFLMAHPGETSQVVLDKYNRAMRSRKNG